MTNSQLRKTISRAALAIPAAIFVIGTTPVENASALRQATPRYFVTDLPSLGGPTSEGRNIDNSGMVAGISDLPGGATRHAVRWLREEIRDLGTLGGPNSAVLWTDRNHGRTIIGIAEGDEVDPRNEAFSCSEFFPGGRPARTGRVCRGVAWDRDGMTPLDTLGGTHSFATGANNRRQVVGWAQTAFEDPTCVGDAVFQFLPVIWNAKTGQIERDLPPFPGDTVGTANAINDKGQVVGISGICDQAVGRESARHAVLWENGTVTDIGNLGADTWNTPLAINQHGDVVGFAGVLDDQGLVQNFGAFFWTKQSGIRPLGTLGDDTHSEAWAINTRRQVAGVSCGTVCSGFLWQDDVLMDLNDLVQPGYPGHIRTARDINDSGVITGQTVNPDTGERRAFVAVPIR